jgi:hypothetical protein
LDESAEYLHGVEEYGKVCEIETKFEKGYLILIRRLFYELRMERRGGAEEKESGKGDGGC